MRLSALEQAVCSISSEKKKKASHPPSEVAVICTRSSDASGVLSLAKIRDDEV